MAIEQDFVAGVAVGNYGLLVPKRNKVAPQLKSFWKTWNMFRAFHHLRSLVPNWFNHQRITGWTMTTMPNPQRSWVYNGLYNINQWQAAIFGDFFLAVFNGRISQRGACGSPRSYDVDAGFQQLHTTQKLPGRLQRQHGRNEGSIAVRIYGCCGLCIDMYRWYTVSHIARIYIYIYIQNYMHIITYTVYYMYYI